MAKASKGKPKKEAAAKESAKQGKDKGGGGGYQNRQMQTGNKDRGKR